MQRAPVPTFFQGYRQLGSLQKPDLIGQLLAFINWSRGKATGPVSSSIVNIFKVTSQNGELAWRDAFKNAQYIGGGSYGLVFQLQEPMLMYTNHLLTSGPTVVKIGLGYKLFNPNAATIAREVLVALVILQIYKEKPLNSAAMRDFLVLATTFQIWDTNGNQSQIDLRKFLLQQQLRGDALDDALKSINEKYAEVGHIADKLGKVDGLCVNLQPKIEGESLYEYMSRESNLAVYIHNGKPSNTLNISAVVSRAFIQLLIIICTLALLQNDLGFVHGDLGTWNVLLSENMNKWVKKLKYRSAGGEVAFKDNDVDRTPHIIDLAEVTLDERTYTYDSQVPTEVRRYLTQRNHSSTVLHSTDIRRLGTNVLSAILNAICKKYKAALAAGDPRPGRDPIDQVAAFAKVIDPRLLHFGMRAATLPDIWWNALYNQISQASQPTPKMLEEYSTFKTAHDEYVGEFARLMKLLGHAGQKAAQTDAIRKYISGLCARRKEFVEKEKLIYVNMQRFEPRVAANSNVKQFEDENFSPKVVRAAWPMFEI